MKRFTLQGFDHVRFYVSNAKQAAYYYRNALGFAPVAYQGLETGNRDATSYALQQGNIFFVVTSPLNGSGAISDHIRAHGDGVRDVALTVNDAAAAWESTTSKGAESVQEPTALEDADGRLVLSAVKTYGDTIHTFVERKGYRGVFLPGFQPIQDSRTAGVGLKRIDHVVGNQPDGGMLPVVEWYEKVMDFHRFWSADDKDISTEYSSLRSIVVASGNEKVKMPINEPAAGLKKSQIQEFIDYYGGAGVQHVAISTRNIISTIKKLRARGVKLLAVPAIYYEELPSRVGVIDEDMAVLASLGILIDRDEKGYMLQIFTEPVQDRPTLFLEIIQRKGGESFGKGNFKALFTSIEREQARRGNL